MLNLHFANLPNAPRDSSALLHWAYTSLYGIQQYLERAKDRIERQTLRLAWEGPTDYVALMAERTRRRRTHSRAEDASDGRNGPEAAPAPPGEWIRLKETREDEPEPEETFDAFFEQDYVSDTPRPGRGNIEVLGRDKEFGLLRVSRLPAGNLVYVHPNTWTLFRQILAIENLWKTPQPEHKPLIQLAEDAARPWPSFKPVRPKEWLVLDKDDVSGVDEEREFVAKALGTPDFAFLEGPPGSGKTITICELILQEIRRGHRILLCASTHVAVDNVLEKLLDQGWMERDVVAVRIGREDDVSELVEDLRLERRIERERRTLISKLRAIRKRSPSQEYLLRALQEEGEALLTRLVLDAANLVCGTTIGILQHPDIKKGLGHRSEDGAWIPDRPAYPEFDVLIVDEASKTPFPEFLVPALYAKRWVLVGDPKQLSPYVDELAVEENLAGIVPEDQGRGILAAFLASSGVRRGTESFVYADEDENVRGFALKQASRLGIPAAPLTLQMVDGGDFSPLWANLLVVDPSEWPRLERVVPSDTEFVMNELPAPLLARRRAHLVSQYRGPKLARQRSRYADTSWAYELSWRLVRRFELRRAPPEESRRYDSAIEKLIPKWASPAELDTIAQDIDMVRRIALPSVLELLQEGFDPERTRGLPTPITHGLPPQVLKPRHTLLTFQHRMHPEISRFPREHIYESKSLRDAEGILAGRDWRYSKGARALWIHVRGGTDPYLNRNLAEVECVIGELGTFMRWASGNPRPKRLGGGPWEVAILTFYRAQETELRSRLQGLFRTNARRHFPAPDGSVRVTVGSVDRFQGHEADVVFLSFVRNPMGRGRWIGFLDSPNRLNVAITRARFQLVLVGNREAFRRQESSELLKKLASEVGSEIQYGEGGAEDEGVEV